VRQPLKGLLHLLLPCFLFLLVYFPSFKQSTTSLDGRSVWMLNITGNGRFAFRFGQLAFRRD
ncbi:hypothetical protein, partial [uncultured Chryseobacterium sp.]|uniref:hypothetical protein n=1 Tax=uncultured Chryseobacterium sp. TaxID=259322 RepID=UPI0025E392FD